MSKLNTDIRLKRTKKTIGNQDIQNTNLTFGEPLFMDNTTGPVSETNCNAYLYIGRKFGGDNESSQSAVTVNNSPVIKCLSKEKADKMAFWDGTVDLDGTIHPEKIVAENGIDIPANRLVTSSVETSIASVDDKYYILCQTGSGDFIRTFNLSTDSGDDVGIFIDGKGRLHGAAWNDIAEFRNVIKPSIDPGSVVCENENGVLEESKERLQACSHVISDTYGQVVGKANGSQAPIAIAGRALVYINEEKDNIHVGDCVCADINGKASIMTRQEVINYPDRILGIVCEIPKYDKWNDIIVDGRIWVNIK